MIFQVGYLLLQCVGRLLQNLSITTLEINTLAIVICSLMIAFAWMHKPSGVSTPIVLSTTRKMGDITSMRCWDTTPLDFVDDNGPGWSMNIQTFMKMPVIPSQRPIQRIPNDRFPMNPYGMQENFLCLAALIFTAVPLTAWNNSFPTMMEKTLWRVSSLFIFCVAATISLFLMTASFIKRGKWRWVWLWVTDPGRLPQLESDASDKSSQVSTSERKPLPRTWEFWALAPTVVIYSAARIYVLMESFLQLRDLDVSAFTLVDWTVYLPHI